MVLNGVNFKAFILVIKVWNKIKEERGAWGGVIKIR